MKRQISLIMLILILLLSGCSSASNLSQPTTVTPGVVPRLDPSPTPSGSTLLLTCQITDLNVYINEADGYCFAYPSRFTLGDQPSDKPDVRGPAIDDSAEPIHATFSVEVSPAALGKSPQEQAEVYLKEFSAADPSRWRISLGSRTYPCHAGLPDCLCSTSWIHVPPHVLAGGYPGSPAGFE